MKTIFHPLPLLSSALILLTGMSGCYTPPPEGKLIESKFYESIPEETKREKAVPRRDVPFRREEAVRIALKNNPSYRSAYAAITGAKMRYYQAIGAYSPTLSGGFAVGQQFYRGNGDGVLPNRENVGYTFTSVRAQWTIFDGLVREFEVMAAKRNVKMQELLNANAKRILEEAVLTAYDDIISSAAQERIAHANLRFQTEELEEARAKNRIGEAPVSNVLNFQAKRDQAEMETIRAQSRKQIALFSLALLLGYTEAELPGGIDPSAPGNAEEAESIHLEEIVFYLNEAVANRPDLNALREGLQILKYRHYQSYGAFSPTLTTFANYTNSTNSNSGDGGYSNGFGNIFISGNSFSYGGAAVWNLFNGFRSYNQLRATKSDLDVAYLQGSYEYLKVVNEIRAAYTDCRSNMQLLKLAASRRETLRKERDLVKKEFQVGDAPLIRLNQVQEDYVKSEFEYISAGAALRKTHTKLRSAAACSIKEEELN